VCGVVAKCGEECVSRELSDENGKEEEEEKYQSEELT
jgi:hypothetical protein